MKLQNKTKKIQIKYKDIEEEAQRLCLKALFDVQQLINMSKEVK